jgi:hypothetical protein
MKRSAPAFAGAGLMQTWTNSQRNRSVKAPVLGSDAIEAGGLPVPGEEFGDLAGRMVGDAGEEVGQVELRIEAVELGGLCRRPNYAEWAGGQP